MNEITFVYDNVKQAYEQGTLVSHTHTLIRGMKAEAWELAEAFYYLRQSVVLAEGETFKKWAAQEYGLSEWTIDRYANVWDTILHAPDSTQIALLEKEINTVIPLGTNVANGGIDLDEIDWDRVGDIDTNGEMREMIREIKGVPEREGTITFQIRESGDVIAWSGEEQAFVGFFEQNPTTELGRKAIARIMHFLKGQ